MTTQNIQKRDTHLNIFMKNQGMGAALPCPTGCQSFDLRVTLSVKIMCAGFPYHTSIGNLTSQKLD
jgi:hypothetical protein